MDQKIEETKDIQKIVKRVLAEQIGVDPKDIKDEDVFADDLHMTAANLSDFLETLGKQDVDVTKIDLTEITTVEELIEILSSQEPIT